MIIAMGKGDIDKYIFPLTSLQIGDLQSYLSQLSLFIGSESKHFYILVDNRPWLKDLVSRPAHVWQLMVTKSRLSPFANSRGRKGTKVCDESELKYNSKPNNVESSKKIKKWFSLVDAATLSQKRALLPVKKLRNSLLINSELHRTLYGFIVFEVAWTDVRGLNYLNELQTDTSLAIESKFMKRWEFDSIAQATSCISSWFSGTRNDQLKLKDYLDAAVGEVFYDAKACFPETSPPDDKNNTMNDDVSLEENSPHTPSNEFSVFHDPMDSRPGLIYALPPPTGPYKRRKISNLNSRNTEVDSDIYSEEKTNKKTESPIQSETFVMSDHEDKVESMEYRDMLILFRFDDPDLPFKLRKIIMSDLRLLTLLESGLPSWVIFVQSYPGFCHLYRPWMCPLVRALYVLISIITVLIGFYDLYKNVPLLKATASGLFGPLVDWIETWEMVSRIKYLGTMLFLHNFEKAVNCFLMITRTVRSFVSVFTQPMAGPLLELMDLILPIWNSWWEVVVSFSSVMWMVIESSCNLVQEIVQIIVQPIWFTLSVIWSIAYTIVYPVVWMVWELLYAPIRLVVVVWGFLALICRCIYEFGEELWMFVSSMLKLASASEAVVVTTYEVPMWRSLWNDLFSQIFKAVRSILNGLVAFFAACNRHRLSIYNHLQEFIQRLFGRSQSSKHSSSQQPEDTRRKIHFS